MADDRAAPPGISRLPGEPPPSGDELAELRELLVGPEQRRLEALRQRLDALALDPDELAEQLPEAIARRASRDGKLARALAPTVESAISESVRRNPREIATAIFPVLGPAIRKAIAQTMAGLVQSINSAIEHSLSARGLRWRFEAWRTGVPYAQIVIRRALVYRVEQVFLIHADSGLLLCHVAAPELKVTDADLVSSMLTAIQDFVSDSFQPADDGGRLRTFSVGELTVFVEQGPQALVAAVVRGQAPDHLVIRLQDALETVHFQLAGPLADFAGDAAPFEAARPPLQDCLHTVLTTDRPARPRPRRARLLWLVPLAAVLLLVVWSRQRAGQRWDAAVARLRAEPGLVLVEAERDGSRWRFAGLRDPLAADPAALLAGMGVAAEDVVGQWRPYLSLEPALIVARARHELAVPDAVTLDLQGDSLVLAGPAPLEWYGRLAAARTGPPGVRSLDLSGLRLVLPPELERRRAAVEERRILFEVGSPVLGAAAAGELRDVAAEVRRLRDAAGGYGAFVRLELVGRTDRTGSDSTNRFLSALRAQAVAGRLAGLGVGDVVASGVGTSQPLSASSESERARLNRSVSFALRVEPGGRTP